MFSISVEQKGRNPRLFEVGPVGEKANLRANLDDIRDLHIDTSLKVLKEEQATGFDRQPRVRVDNKFGKSIFAVKDFGQIEFYARLTITETIMGIYREIWNRTPVVTGQYRSGNYVFLNNKVVATTPAELKGFVRAYEKIGFNDTDVIRFINVNPYARKLERYGISKGRSRVRTRESKDPRNTATIKVPNGAYVLAHRAARRKFKAGASFMKFSFHVNGRRGINIQATGRFRNTFKTKKYRGQPYLYPMISLAFSPEGIVRE